MEVEKLKDFLKNCCRVCLSVENEMVESSNIVENFNKTIDELLFECANLKMVNGSGYPQKLCELCTTELVMIAKFREKCEMSSTALDQIKHQINKFQNKLEEHESLQIEPANIRNARECELSTGNSNSDTFYENIEYSEDNVEYVIYDTNTEFIDEVDIPEKSLEDSVELNGNSTQNPDEDDAYTRNFESKKKKFTSTRNQNTKSKSKNKRNMVAERNLAMKSMIKYHCKQCGAGFAQFNNFTKHLQTHSENEPDSIIDKYDGEYSIDVRTNVNSDATHQNSTSSSRTNSIDQRSTNRKNNQKNHGCSFCDRSFPSHSLLATHTRIHTGERPFQCDFDTCSKAFKTQGALDLHARRHSGVKPYKCLICNRGFVESSNLKVHMRTHTGEKPHRCITCGRSFSRVFLLQIHQRTHTGEKPFGCEICSKSFAQQGDLSAHRRIHSGERPHRCKICHKGFIKSSGLTQHMRRHLRTNPKASTNVNKIETIKETNEQIEKVMVCYKEFNENSESLDELILQD